MADLPNEPTKRYLQLDSSVRSAAKAGGKHAVYVIGAFHRKTWGLEGIKVGITQNATMAQSRLAALRIGSPDNLAILAVLEDIDRSLERDIHKQFEPDHIHGEWFEPSNETWSLVNLIHAINEEKVTGRRVDP